MARPSRICVWERVRMPFPRSSRTDDPKRGKRLSCATASGEGHPNPLPSAGDSGERLVFGRVDRNRQLQPGDLQDSADLVVLAADHEATAVAVAVEALPGADDQGDPGGVDELALGEVDQDRALIALERLLQGPLEIGGGTQVQLAAYRDSPDAA